MHIISFNPTNNHVIFLKKSILISTPVLKVRKQRLREALSQPLDY